MPRAAPYGAAASPFSYTVKEKRADRDGGGDAGRVVASRAGRGGEEDWHLQWEREAFSL